MKQFEYNILCELLQSKPQFILVTSVLLKNLLLKLVTKPNVMCLCSLHIHEDWKKYTIYLRNSTCSILRVSKSIRKYSLGAWLSLLIVISELKE